MNRERLHFLVALPRLDSSSGVEDLPEGVSGSVAAVRAHYGERQAPRVRMLPHDVDYEAVVASAAAAKMLSKSRLAIGINEEELRPVVLNFDEQPHLVAFADAECGKTSLLRNIATGLMRSAKPDECRIILIDFRRSMLGVVDNEFLSGYATSAQSCTELVADLSESLKDRLPPRDVTQQQLKERSWWSGPELFLMIDDYDLVSTGSSYSSPLAPLVDYLPQARDIGLRVIVTRRSGGAGRAMGDPVIGRLRDLSCNALVMSGSREEGPLFGHRATQMPPGRGMLVSRTMKSGVIQLSKMPDL